MADLILTEITNLAISRHKQGIIDGLRLAIVAVEFVQHSELYPQVNKEEFATVLLHSFQKSIDMLLSGE